MGLRLPIVHGEYHLFRVLSVLGHGGFGKT